MVRIKTILCPVDFFPASLKAFDYALKLASNYGAGVYVLHVVSPMVPTAYDFPVNISEYTGALEQVSRRELLKLKKKADGAKVPFQSQVLVGGIDDGIHKAVTRTRADIVVMGTHGRRGFERWIMGSETDRLIRTSPVPVLTIASARGTRTSPPEIRRILVTTDFSAGTSDAIKYAFSMAKECHARVTLVHVVHSVAMEASPEIAAPVLLEAQTQLERLVPAGARKWCEVKVRVDVGVAYQTILKIQKSEKIDLLVMNVHGKGMIDRALVGSTAERVVRAAACPVLLIPPSAQSTKRGRSSRRSK
jgi:nucleotide-binding universal stress UspA family protein